MVTKVLLADIADVVMGQSPPGETCNKTGEGSPLLNGPTEFGAKYPIPVQFTTAPTKIAVVGDILFCVRGSTTGRMNYADQAYVLGRGVAAIRGKNGYRTPYIRALVDMFLPALLQEATGSTFPNVSRDQLLRQPVMVLPPADADRVGSFFEAVENKAELNRRLCVTLEEIARTIFRSWFVDFDPVRAKIAAKAEGRDPERAAMAAISGKSEDELDALPAETLASLAETAALFPDAFVDSLQGEIPEGWQTKPLNHLAYLDTTSVSPSSEPDTIFEYFSIPALDATGLPAIEVGRNIKSNKYRVQKTSVLVSKLNPENPRIWFPDVNSESAICSTEFMQFVPLSPQIRPYLYLLMNSTPMQDAMQRQVTGSTGSRQRVQPSQITQMPVALPPYSMTDSFSALVMPMLARTASARKESVILNNCRDTLLPKLLSGEFDLMGDILE